MNNSNYDNNDLSPSRQKRQKQMQRRKKSNSKLSRRRDHMNRNLLILVILVIALFESDIIAKMVTSSSQIANNQAQIQQIEESERQIQEAKDKAKRESEQKAAAESEAAAKAHSIALPDSDSIVRAQPVECDLSYFDDAVFIGDSRIEGFKNLAGLTNSTYLSAVGMQIEKFDTTPYISTANGPVTVLEALKEKQYGKVYVMMGVNETGWYSWDGFFNSYKKILAEIREAQPDAIMYVYGCFYVEESKVSTSYVTNANINTVNKYILEICQQDGYNYLDLNLVFDNGNGGLLDGASADGVHLEQSYYPLWINYLRTHYIPEETTTNTAAKTSTPSETAIDESESDTESATGVSDEVMDMAMNQVSSEQETETSTEAKPVEETELQTENLYGVDYESMPPTIRIRQTLNS